jgi:hypothetical protein
MDCRRCGKSFSGKSSLIAHLRGKKICAPIISDVNREEIINEEHGRKIHQCVFCEKKYAHIPTPTSHQCKGTKKPKKEEVKEEPKKRGRKKKEQPKEDSDSAMEETMKIALKKALRNMADKL